MEVDKEAGCGPSKRSHREQPAADLLGALPDALLLHILSFLRVRDAISTALLSRRWRHLWTSTPSLDFSRRSHPDRRGRANYVSPAFIDRALALHDGTKVRALRVAVRHPQKGKQQHLEVAKLAQMVDSCVGFTSRCRVEELELDFVDPGGGGGCVPALLTLPRSLFACESLVSLRLRCCRLDLPLGISMSALKTLTLSRIEDTNHAILGCRSLESLTFEDCNLSHAHNVVIYPGENPRLKTLKVFDTMRRGVPHPEVCINAPGITTLVLGGYLREYYVVDDLLGEPLIATARLDFGRMFGCVFRSGDRKCFEELLRGLRQVKVLKLCNWCVQAFSVIACGRSKPLLEDFNITTLELAIGFVTFEFPGIFYALHGFTKLESLIIHTTCENRTIIALDDITEYENRSSPPETLQQLKTVTIFGFWRAICAKRENKTGEKVHEKCENGFKFIHYLLKNSPVLEKLTISAPDINKLTKRNLMKYASRLLALPRASPNALVIIQDK